MQSTKARFGAGGQFPFPKEVWAPSGGWWSRPSNWKSNTVVVAIGITTVMYGIWQYSAENEWRHVEPTRPIPSQMWAKQFKSGEIGVRDESAFKGTPSAEHH